MDWLRKLIEQVKNLWGQWKPLQKIIFVSIVAVVVVGIILLLTVSAQPTRAELFSRPITDPETLDRIGLRLDEEGIAYTVTTDNRVLVDDLAAARRARSILIREDLVPADTDPWQLFDVERWTQTDFERNVNLRRAITTQLEMHIEAISDVDNASVTIAFPEDRLFLEEQNPVTASVVLMPKPGSDIRENRAKIEGIEKLIQFAIEGLTPDNITITDTSGIVLNDFDALTAFDRIQQTRQELELKSSEEQRIRGLILEGLSGMLTADRVRIPRLEVEIDMSQKEVSTREVLPTVIREDNPLTPFDDSQLELYIPLSIESTEEQFRGTGFNPEGPPGQEGQTPPAYQDLQDTVGEWSNTVRRQNNEISTRETQEVRSPTLGRRSVGVAIDGIWRKEYDDNGQLIINSDGSIERTYTPPSPELLQSVAQIVEHAIGYDAGRGDSVTVQHVQFDRTDEQLLEDEAARRQQQVQQIVLYSLIGIAVLLIAFIAFRLISREVERRRRLREEELARQHQAMREAALRSAEEEGTEVEMSVEERARLEMQENAINMAREHPEDVAQLIRTWLMEE
ncbi:MAG TPA: flagellar basal-body MS-ring/collar protein FliF [Spirochaetia bacterium]|nr:flagellar basal-body MS-ring/collar protein FliF [Spirochaetia bacterium]